MKFLLAVIVFQLLGLSGAVALERPTGKVVLTIRGAVENTNLDGVVAFDQAMLDALEGRDATVPTPWAPQPTRFAGPYLRAVLEAAGAKGTRLVVRALNDYSAEVPVSDATEYATILASKMDGRPMSVRDKGPLMVVYPFDLNPGLYNERYFTRSVWQVSDIEVLP